MTRQEGRQWFWAIFAFIAVAALTFLKLVPAQELLPRMVSSLSAGMIALILTLVFYPSFFQLIKPEIEQWLLAVAISLSVAVGLYFLSVYTGLESGPRLIISGGFGGAIGIFSWIFSDSRRRSTG